MCDCDKMMNEVMDALRHLSGEVEKLRQLVVETRPELLSKAQVAQLVGVSEKHIQRAIREGKLPCSNIGGQNRPTLRVAHADVVEWMRSTKIDVAATGSVRQSANGNRSARTHPNVPMPQPRIRGR